MPVKEVIIKVDSSDEKFVTYKMDTEKNELIYNTHQNLQGRMDYDIQESAENMCKLAKLIKCDVVATFNNVPIRATTEMKPEDVVQGFEDYFEKKRQEYLASPEYQEDLKRQAEEKAKREAQIKADDEKIKDVKLDVSGHDVYFNDAKEKCSKNKYDASIIGFAERWGKLMQTEMDKAKTTVLTKGIADRTKHQADIPYGMSGASFGAARNILIKSWKHGEQLGKLHGFSKEEIAEARAETTNEVYSKKLQKEKSKKTGATKVPSKNNTGR